jgi:photosystem II stability/assembly factor-like uncharacterized protein
MRLPRIFYTLVMLITAASLVAVRADNRNADVISSASGSKDEVRRWEVTGPWGGDVREMISSPTNPELLYLGTSDGQIFRSTDGSRTWRRLKPGLDKRGLSVDDIIMDPRDTRVMYCGAWAVAAGNESAGGVFKSTDGGENWKLLARTKGLKILSLAMAPIDSNFLIAGAQSGVFRSTDGGDNWERISPERHAEIRNINSVAIDPKNNDVIYIGTHHLPWKTTDGGKTWKQTGYQAVGMIDDSDIMGICVNPVDSSLVYMNACSGIYRSNSGGEKWTKLPGIPFSARRTYALMPHPTQPNIIFAGTSEGLWRTRDGGKRWQLLTSKTVVIHSIVVHPDRPNRVLIATDDFGVRVSEDLGDTFAEANTGFIHRHILTIMPDASERGRILASVYHDGTSGSLFVSTDGGDNWQPSSRGLGSRDVFALYQVPDSPNVIYAGTNTGVYRSDDRGASWVFVGLEKKETPAKKPPVRRAPSRRRASVASPAVMSTPGAVGSYQTVAAQRRSNRKPKAAPKKSAKKKPKVEPPLGPPLVTLMNQVDDIAGFVDSDGRRGLMAATMEGLYRTTDETKGWEKVNITGYDMTGRVYSVSTHKDTPNRIFVGTKGGLYVSYDSGRTWEQSERGPGEVIVKAIAQDPTDPDTIILGTNQFIFRSTNGGRTWVRKGGGLPGGDFTAVIINPSRPDEMLVAEYSRGGVYRSVDKGHSWERIDAELPSNRVWTLTFDPFERNRIYAGSFSSGVYVLTIQRGTSTAQEE